MAQFRKFFILFVVALLPLSAFANDGAQSTIGEQLRAFQSDNDAIAYSFAAPNVKKIFPTLDSFMGMVKGMYKPLHRPQSWAFGRVQSLGDGTVAQEVYIVDQTGRDWTALYTLQQSGDIWKITGVSLKKADTLTM